jgi:cysteinyl-tRNA synthetase
MNDDFNTPEAIKNLYELRSLSQSYLSKEPKITVLERALNTIMDMSSIFGIMEGEERKESKISDLMENILKIREKYREEGKYEEADKIRDVIEEAGLIVEDTKRGPRWKEPK